MEFTLECTNISKSYRNQTVLNHVSLRLEPNRIYGLLGKNGAGKSTLLNIIGGHIFADSGEIYINGQLVIPGQLHHAISYLRESPSYFRGASIHEILRIAAPFHQSWDWSIANKLLEVFQLKPDAKYSKLSQGMKKMVGITLSIASRAPITIVDEPVNGLDVMMRERYYNQLLEDYHTFPRTIVISTHLIDEVSNLLEHIMILDKGKLMLNENVEDLKNKTYILYGNATVLDQMIDPRYIIHTEKLGNKQLVMLYQQFTDEKKRELSSLGIEIDHSSLHRFFAHFLEGRGLVEYNH